MQPTCLKVSLPITAYINAPLSTVNNLQDRMKNHEAIPSGIRYGYVNSIILLSFLLMLICCVLIGWTDELMEGTLVIYKVEVFQTGPEFVLSLTIHEDFSWTLCYQKQYVDRQFFCLLSDIPSGINTGIQLNRIGKL